ncbi:hypothetical protein LCGC14_0728010 [marine sediment metagenome]|uniref:Uncharacterized protein n=1 Tax=marine sediment metagenome TaxID=412755 RepID=A0A0F9QEL7_9ZZZZ
MNTDAKAEIRTLIETQLSGMTARHGLLKMLDSDVPTILNYTATEQYQDGPSNVAEVVERMVSLGVIVPADTPRWWPSQLQALRELLRDRPGKIDRTGNPPCVWATDHATGNLVYRTIESPTAEALDAAIAAAKSECEDRKKTTQRRIAAEREVDDS